MTRFTASKISIKLTKQVVKQSVGFHFYTIFLCVAICMCVYACVCTFLC